MTDKEIRNDLDHFAELCGKAMPLVWVIDNKEDFDLITKVKGNKRKYRLIKLDLRLSDLDPLA